MIYAKKKIVVWSQINSFWLFAVKTPWKVQAERKLRNSKLNYNFQPQNDLLITVCKQRTHLYTWILWNFHASLKFSARHSQSVHLMNCQILFNILFHPLWNLLWSPSCHFSNDFTAHWVSRTDQTLLRFLKISRLTLKIDE